jgi:hypothetical protein
MHYFLKKIKIKKNQARPSAWPHQAMARAQAYTFFKYNGTDDASFAPCIKKNYVSPALADNASSVHPQNLTIVVIGKAPRKHSRDLVKSIHGHEKCKKPP